MSHHFNVGISIKPSSVNRSPIAFEFIADYAQSAVRDGA